MSVGKRARQDPWPELERQMTEAVNDLIVEHQKFSTMQNRTVIAENTFRGVISSVDELLRDAKLALDAVVEHPELFAMSTEELQRRSSLVRQWERDLTKANDELASAEKKRQSQAQLQSAAAAAGVAASQLEAAQRRKNEENSDFLRQEYEQQVGTMAEQDETVTRIHQGVIRIKGNAVLINEELDKQAVMLEDAHKGMDKVQVKLEGALKKVGKLLDESSDRTKYICIFVLLLILALLMFFLFGSSNN